MNKNKIIEEAEKAYSKVKTIIGDLKLQEKLEKLQLKTKIDTVLEKAPYAKKAISLAGNKKVLMGAGAAALLIVILPILLRQGVELVEFNGDCPGNGELIVKEGNKQQECQFTDESKKRAREYTVRIPGDSESRKRSLVFGFNGASWALFTKEETQLGSNKKVRRVSSYEVKFNDIDENWKQLLAKEIRNHSNGKLSSEKLYVMKQTKSGKWSTQPSLDRSFSANGKLSSERKYEAKEMSEGSWSSALIQEISYYSNGKIRSLNTKKAVQTGKRLVSYPTKKLRNYDNGKPKFEELFEVKETSEGKWGYARTSEKSFNTTAKLTKEVLSDAKVDEGRNQVVSIPVKITRNDSTGVNLVYSESSEAHYSNGRWKAFLKHEKKMKSVGYGKDKKYIVDLERTNEVKQNKNKDWQSLAVKKVRYSRNTDRQASETVYVSKSTEYTIKENDSAALVSLETKSTIDTPKYKIRAPRNAKKGEVFFAGGTKADTLYTQKKNDSGNWGSFVTEETKIYADMTRKKLYTLKKDDSGYWKHLITEDTKIYADTTTKILYGSAKTTSGNWSLFKTSSTEMTKKGQITQVTKYVTKTNDDDRIASYKSSILDYKDGKVSKEIKYNVIKNDRGQWKATKA